MKRERNSSANKGNNKKREIQEVDEGDEDLGELQ